MKRNVILFVLLLSYSLSWSGNIKNVSILTQDYVNTKRGIFVVNRHYDLDGKTIVIPKNLAIKFEKGMMDNGTIVGTETNVNINRKACVFGKKIKIQGSWYVKEIYDKWFEFDSDKNFISNQIIENILSLSNDDEFCHIYFNEKRVYYIKLQTRVAPNIGNNLSYDDVKNTNGKNRRNYHYEEVFGDKYYENRIFTIPSNTWVTINNKIQMLPTNQGVYFIFWEFGKKNITIDGKGCISGDVKDHLYTDPFFKNTKYFGEWGYVFRCFNCENFIFKDIELSDSFGDLLGYGCYPVEDGTLERGSQGLVVDNVKFVRARRNGVAVSAKDVVIKKCIFKECGTDEIKGTAPRAAIDFENDYILKYPDTGNENVIMKNCYFVNNKHDVSATWVNVPDYGKTAVTIKNCHFSSPIRLNATPHWVKFKNCTIPSFTNSTGIISKTTPIRYVVFEKCYIKSIPQLMLTSQWHNQFVRCKIVNVKK